MVVHTGKLFNGIALCAGAGGLELGLSLAIPGYRTVCWCERDAYAASALVARMEDEVLDKAPVWSDLNTFDGFPWRGKVDILTAGYPCQPFSACGRRTGESDPRHLWPHVRRVLKECGARMLFAENVLGHVSLGLETVWSDLCDMGYEVAAGIFSAAEVGASHIRQRLFILAYADMFTIRELARHLPEGRETGSGGRETSAWNTCGGQGVDFALDGGHIDCSGFFPPSPDAFPAWEDWLAARPDLLPCVVGTHDGLAGKMDRYRLVGNGVVPLEAAYAFCTLALNATKKVDKTA